MAFDNFDGFLDRDEVLRGLPARRAQAILYLIETRTAHRIAGSRQALQEALAPDGGELELAFVEAFALGKAPPVRPTIQGIERHAAAWAPLVPTTSGVRAALAHLLAQKYAFTARAAPGIRAALALDTAPVQDAYRRQYGRPLDASYAPTTRPLARLRWAWHALAVRLENLPPFWTAFALTLTETVGAGTLAIPIAVAVAGPAAGLAILIMLGALNLLTIAWMSEAVARSGVIRAGRAFYGRLAGDYLGGAGSLIASVVLTVRSLVAPATRYIGVASTLALATGLPMETFPVVLFLVAIYLLSRKSADSTVVSALVVGALNIVLILALSLLAFLHWHAAYLTGGTGFGNLGPDRLRLILGVGLAAYAGHISLCTSAPIVLSREPSGRALMGGSLAAQLVATLIFTVWVVGVNGAVAPGRLANETGTALVPLAPIAGPVVVVLGSLYVLLGMGMGTINASNALFKLVHERLPRGGARVVLLPRARARLHVDGGSGARGAHLALSYRGLDGTVPHLVLDLQVGERAYREDLILTAGIWALDTLAKRIPGLAVSGLRLALEALDATPGGVRLRITSSARPRYEGDWDVAGLDVLEIADLPAAQRDIVQWVMRQGTASAADLAASQRIDESAARSRLAALAAQGYLATTAGDDQTRYRANLGRRRGRALPAGIWSALDNEAPPGAPASRAGTARVRPSARLFDALLLSPGGRFALAMTPVLLVFLVVEWLLVVGASSFAALYDWQGVVAVPFFAGLFPALLLAAARRKGEFLPLRVARWLAGPFLLALVYLLFLGGILLHGLIIWQTPLERASAIAVCLAMAWATTLMLRRGALNRRLVMTLQDDQRVGRPALTAHLAGVPMPLQVRLRDARGVERAALAAGEHPVQMAGLAQVSVDLPAGLAEEVLVRAQQVTADGQSQSLPAILAVHGGRGTRQFDLTALDGRVRVPLGGTAHSLDLVLPAPRTADPLVALDGLGDERKQ